MKVRKLLELQSKIEERKVPCDLCDDDLKQHYSESNDGFINILDMDLIHLVRAYSKCLGKKHNYNKQIISDSIDNILENINEVNRVLSE